jgi:hypothetical protein
MATGLVRVDMSTVHAPRPVLAACGLAFVIAGIMMLGGGRSKVNDLCAALLLLAMGSIGTWVALFGQSASFSGGVPLISHQSNVTVDRVVFAAGALISFALSAVAMRRLFSQRA